MNRYGAFGDRVYRIFQEFEVIMTKRGNKNPSQRQLRVGEELRHALAQILGRGDLRDPDLAGVSVTVSEVRISPDLRNAVAFVTPLGGGDQPTVVAAMTRAAPYLRRKIGEAVRLRYVPNLTFEGDTTFDYANHIGEILESVDNSAEPGDN